MAGPTIVSTSPSSGAEGVPTNITISVIFDQEIDTYRLKNGGIFLEGPDESKSIGPGMLALSPPPTDEDEFLSSPGFKGIKETDFTFSRVDGSGNSVDYYDYGNTSGAGELYRTKVVLTPKRILQSLTDYTVYIVGDEDTTDEYDFGLSSRSVFDPLKGPNIGTGDVVFYGGYTGSSRQQFSVQITTAGAPGTAEYEWWTSTDSLHRTGTSSLGYRLLKEGVKIKFLEGQQYEVGDLFTVWCDVPEFMDGSYKFSFTTSSVEPETLPVASTLLSGITSSSSSTASSVLTLLESNPTDRDACVDSDLTQITATFSASLDASTITDSTVTVQGEVADGSKTGTYSYTETLTKSLSVSGATVTITVDPDEVFDNNVIIVTFDSTVASTEGATLASDTSFFFGTEYTPFYAGIRHVRLRLGSIGNSFPDETVALAIWDASLEANAFAPHILTITDQTGYNRARQQFVVCFAAWILISGSGAASGESVRKRLGDFDVSRSPGSGAGFDDDLKDCVDYYQAILERGGEVGLVHKPLNVVKGDNDTDMPHSGRLWEIPEVPIGNARVLYSGSRRWYKSHLSRLRSSMQRTRWRRN
jgi:hypothetical protein